MGIFIDVYLWYKLNKRFGNKFYNAQILYKKKEKKKNPCPNPST